MRACMMGLIDIARMLLVEFHANIEIQNDVRAIVILVLCGDVAFDGVVFIAPLYWGVSDVL